MLFRYVTRIMHVAVAGKALAGYDRPDKDAFEWVRPQVASCVTWRPCAVRKFLQKHAISHAQNSTKKLTKSHHDTLIFQITAARKLMNTTTNHIFQDS